MKNEDSVVDVHILIPCTVPDRRSLVLSLLWVQIFWDSSVEGRDMGSEGKTCYLGYYG